MKQLLLSIGGAILILSFLIAGLMLGAYVELGLHGPSWIGTLFYFLLCYPLFIFGSLLGSYQSGFSDHEPNSAALLATLITHLFVYSFLVYFILWWRTGKKLLR